MKLLKFRKFIFLRKSIALALCLSFITTSFSETLLLAKATSTTPIPENLAAPSPLAIRSEANQHFDQVRKLLPTATPSPKAEIEAIAVLFPILITALTERLSNKEPAEVAKELREAADDLRSVASSLLDPSQPIESKTLIGKLLVQTLFAILLLRRDLEEPFNPFILARIFEEDYLF